MLIAFDIVDFPKSAGCEVVGPFAKVSETLTAAARHDIDLAVLDINLRGEAVWPVADVLRERRVPFLFLTGYPKSDQLQNTIWLEKPFVGETLLETLAALSKASASPNECANFGF
jgi:DNA-binding response OmpR family regulator